MNPTDTGTPPARNAKPAPGPAYYVRKGLKSLASLQLTVCLFAVAVGLVFLGTVAQVDYGIWTVVDQYFWSWAVWVPFDLFHKFGVVFFDLDKESHWSGSFPFPAGKLLGGLMLLNLLAAHAIRFRVSWKRIGIFMIHSGMILLFVGEFVTREFAVEQRMTINQGESVNYTEDSRLCELAFLTPGVAGKSVETATVVPESKLKQIKTRITHPELPVDLEVLEFMPNSTIVEPTPNKPNLATAGEGLKSILVKRPEFAGADTEGKVDHQSVYVAFFKKGTEEKLGVYAVSQFLNDPQPVVVDGKTYGIVLRFQRYRKPYTIHLAEFKHDKYMGTDKAKNFSSRVVLLDPEEGVQREVVISMNDPLRYGGETFYQGGFDPRTDSTTILQVVHNPGWIIPYISCILVGLGMVVHFGIYLVQFLTRRVRGISVKPPVPVAGTEPVPLPPMAPVPEHGEPAPQVKVLKAPGEAGSFLPWVILAIISLYLLSAVMRMNPPQTPYNLDAFAKIPVVEGGRVKPLETFARVQLRQISHRETFIDIDGNTQPAIRWYLDVIAGGMNGKASEYKVFRIENDQLLAELKLKPREGLRYSYSEFAERLEMLGMQIQSAAVRRQEKKPLEKYEEKLLELRERVITVQSLETLAEPLMVPPQSAGEEWQSLAKVRNDVARVALSETLKPVLAAVTTPEKFAQIAPDQRRKMLITISGDKNPPTDQAEVDRRLRALLLEPTAKLSPEDAKARLTALAGVLPEFELKALPDRTRELEQKLIAQKPIAALWNNLLDTYVEGRAAEAALTEKRGRTPDLKLQAEARDVMAAKATEFNTILDDYRAKLGGVVPADVIVKAGYEAWYNRAAPFYYCTALYVFVAFLCCISWLMYSEPLRKSAYYTLYLTLIIHTAALIARMYFQDRWGVFVTNLYSSAVFIGFGCVALCLLLERLFPMGIGNIVGAVLGIATAIISHNLGSGGDTQEMMQAVLDTNFWLATHVTTVTFGYTATFVAGFIAIAYIARMLATVIRDSFRAGGPAGALELFVFSIAATGVVAIPVMLIAAGLNAAGSFEVIPGFLADILILLVVVSGGGFAAALTFARASLEGVPGNPNSATAPEPPAIARPICNLALDAVSSKKLTQMIYGVVCFAMLLSFVGTVLGGIWADQSWGRFWGWDPKENGAVLIVLWNALILHARWCGLVRDRGLAVLAVAGTMITAWSWFGTNQLGIGLHAYGFDKRLAVGCRWYWISQLVIIAVGLIPRVYWSGAAQNAATATPVPGVPTIPVIVPPQSTVAPASPTKNVPAKHGKGKKRR